jgi:Flp pilus assembly protein TadG
MEHVNFNRAFVRPAPRRRAARHGLATVEMALLLPLLLVLTFAAVEYGWMFFKQQQITNAAREAARLGATPNGTNATVTARVTQLMTDAGIQGGQYTLAIDPGVGGLTPTTLFTVTISVDYPAISLTKMADPSKAVYIPAPARLTASVAMNKEGP